MVWNGVEYGGVGSTCGGVYDVLLLVPGWGRYKV